jgi:methylated-DNA-[protein]-cysteine S-methyltransferase
MSLFFTAVPTRLGVFFLIMSRLGLRRLILPGQPHPDFKRINDSCAGGLLATTDHNAPVFRGLPARLVLYASGDPTDFSTQFDFDPPGSDFQRKVWTEVMRIPRGTTRSYKEIASAIGNPSCARAVGQALKHNPAAIVIPCHRVITADGRTGGFAGGFALKTRLLKLENALL